MTPEEAIEILGDFGKQVKAKADGAYQTNVGKMACDMAIEALEEAQKYREIGTVEECRKSVEKQKPKKIVYESDSVFSNGFSHYRMGKCPMCDKYYNSNDEVNYCSKCGQAIQWDENLEGMEDEL